MNLIKSFFIFISPAWMCFIIIQGISIILNTHLIWLGLGLILSALPFMTFLSNLLLVNKIARTSQHLFLVSFPSLAGYAMVFIVFYEDNSYTNLIAMMYAMSAFLITILYIYWYSNNARKKSPLITNGKALPEIFVQDFEGNQVNLQTLHDQKALIFFYRGNWCPLCMAQIVEIAASYKKFADGNINVVFIAPQSSKNTQKLAGKFNLNFKFYTDENNQSAKKLGIAHAYGLPMGFQVLGYDSETVYPTVIAIDENGIILYNDQTDNYRLRPEPEDLLKIFD